MTQENGETLKEWRARRQTEQTTDENRQQQEEELILEISSKDLNRLQQAAAQATELERENKNLKSELSKVRSDNDRLIGLNDKLNSENENLSHEKETARQNEELTNENNRLKQKNDTLTEENSQLKEDIATANQRADTAEARVKTARSDAMEEAKKALEDDRKTYDKQKSQLDTDRLQFDKDTHDTAARIAEAYEKEIREKLAADVADTKAKQEQAEQELIKAKEIREKRQKELLPPLMKGLVGFFAIICIVLGHWAWWGYKVGVADDFSETVIGKKQITIKHFFRKDELKTVDDTQKYIKPLIQGLYDLSDEKENSTVDDRVLKAIVESWEGLEFKPQQEQPKEQKTKAPQQKKQDKQQKKKDKPKAATAKDIETIKAVEKSEQPQQSEEPATGLQQSTAEQKEADRRTIEKARKQMPAGMQTSPPAE